MDKIFWKGQYWYITDQDHRTPWQSRMTSSRNYNPSSWPRAYGAWCLENSWFPASRSPRGRPSGEHIAWWRPFLWFWCVGQRTVMYVTIEHEISILAHPIGQFRIQFIPDRPDSAESIITWSTCKVFWWSVKVVINLEWERYRRLSIYIMISRDIFNLTSHTYMYANSIINKHSNDKPFSQLHLVSFIYFACILTMGVRLTFPNPPSPSTSSPSTW